MDKDRDEILNDLIKYYDTGKKDNAADIDETSDSSGTSEADMGATRIVTAKQAPAPDSETAGGDTIIVNVQQEQNRQTNPQELPDDATRHIGPVQEEVLGNLGLDGLPISETNAHSKEASVRSTDTYDDGTADSSDNTLSSRSDIHNDDYYDKYDEFDDEYDDEYDSDNSRGVWYTFKPLWITLILSCLIVGGFFFYMTDTGIIGSYKRNFEYNMNMLMDMFGIQLDESVTDPMELSDNASTAEEFEADLDAASASSAGTQQTGEIRDNVREETVSVYEPVEEARASLPFVEAGSSEFAVYGSGIVCAKSNYLCLYNSSGELKWEYSTDIQDPILCTAGNYIALAAEGGTRVSLYKNDELQFTVDADNNIISCDVSERGDIVLVTERSAYKGAVSVFNRRGEEIFSWASGVNYITSASILKTRLVAVSLVNAESEVTSYLMVFDIEAPDPLAGVELTNTLIFDVFDNGKTIYTCGDNSISSMSEYCEVNYDKRFDDAELTHTSNDGKGNRIISFTVQNIPALNVYNRAGDLLCTLAADNTPDHIGIYGKTVLYNNGRDIICGSAKSEQKTVYTAPMDIKQLLLINSSTYLVVYENSIEFIRI